MATKPSYKSKKPAKRLADAKFGKVENNPETTPTDTREDTIEMSISHAPSKLIIQYITDMYAHPLEAAIRETTANAIDASCAKHGSIGCVRTEVKEGNHGYYFEVADDGEGMTYDDLVSIYIQYGVSDKRDDDSQTGAFGLGSKSPLAYTDRFWVITKTKSDGCLFLYGLRSDDNDFLAGYPVKVEGKTKVSHPITGESFFVEDPFGKNKTGTVVRFPIEEPIKPNGEKSAYDVMRAERIVHAMDSVFKSVDGYSLAEGRPLASERPSYEFLVKAFSDKAGNTVEARFLLSESLSTEIRTCGFRFNDVFDLAARQDSFEKGQRNADLHDDDLSRMYDRIAFKVGCWLYPASGVAWHDETFREMRNMWDVIVEVPSAALPFIPSRDSLRIDSKTSNISSFVEAAFSRLGEMLDDPSAMTDVVNWCRFGGSFDSALNCSCSCVDYSLDMSVFPSTLRLERRNNGTYYSRTATSFVPYSFELLADSLEVLDGVSLSDARQSPVCLVGMASSSDAGNWSMRNGPLGCWDDESDRLFGATYSNPNDYVYTSWKGWGYTSSKNAVDDIVAEGYIHPDVSYASTKKRSGGKEDVTCNLPVALSLAHMVECGQKIPQHFPIIVIDATSGCVGKARSKIASIITNLGYSGAKCFVAFVIIPPKSADSQWTPSEKKKLIAEVNRYAKARSKDVRFVSEDEIGTLTAKKKAAVSSSELEKTVRLSKVVCLEKDSRDGELHFAFNPYNKKHKQLAADIIASPKTWGVVIADSHIDRPYDAAELYAQTMFAIGIIPHKISHLVCIGSDHYNVARANYFKTLGVSVIYDESNTTPYATLVEPGTFTKLRPLNSGNSRIICSLDPASLPPELRAMSRRDRIKRENNDILSIWYSALELRDSYPWGVKVNAEQMVEAVAFGKETYKVPAEPDAAYVNAKLPPWKYTAFQNTILEEDAENDDYDQFIENLKTIWKLWKMKLAEAAMKVIPLDFTPTSLRILIEVGLALDVDGALDALYEGASFEQIFAGSEISESTIY